MSVTDNNDFQRQHEALLTEALKAKAVTLETIIFTLDNAHHQMNQMYAIEVVRRKTLDAAVKRGIKDGAKITEN